MPDNKTPNRLINEKSPYLLQHAYNPVDWYLWGDEAFNKAKAEDKPIFLSIGYSTCHWCHVMERESFEDEEVAEVLNKHFISIKVDREERPDIDSIYMTVCQALTGSGGWPLTIIMTPGKKPFYAGTYFPKESKYGRPGIIDLLMGIKEAWDTKHGDIVKSSENILDAVRKSSMSHDEEEIGMETIDEGYEEFRHFFDSTFGGFGSPPKFPSPHNLSFLMRYYASSGKPDALEMVEKTLESMYKGGMFDHIGFGFSRYSTDKKWLVPHFEKMLYDNALLAIAYAEGYQVTGNELYKNVVDKIFTYILRDMTSPDGGFYSAEDADSEGEEGKFYVWSPDEVKSALGDEDGEYFCRFYDITEKGNFEGKSIPNLIRSGLKEIGEDREVYDRLNSIREKLFLRRQERIHPYKDDKILTSWNGLMIAAFAYGGRALSDNRYIDAAKKAVDFIFKKLVRDDGRLLARYRDGESAYPGYLEDYAFLIYGLIELYESTFETYYLKKALELNKDMLKLFWDEKGAGLFLYGRDSEELIVRPKEVYDGAIPSGNSAAALNMLRLSRIAGDMELEDKANTIFRTFGGIVKQTPNSYSFFLMALFFANMPSKEIVIAGQVEDPAARDMLYEINKRFLPFSTVVFNHGDDKLYEIAPFVKEQKKIKDKSTAYVCENYACSQPVTSADELKGML